MLFSCCYLPAKSIEEDLQISTEAQMEVGETKLSDSKNTAEGDRVTEPVKTVETQSRGVTNPAPALGNSATIMPFLSYFASCKLCEVQHCDVVLNLFIF